MNESVPSREVAATANVDLPGLIAQHTPARLLVGRAGASYRTATLLELRGDHAAARDAVREEFDLLGDLGQPFADRWRLFEVSTLARDKREYLLRPDRGRGFGAEARAAIVERCPAGVDLQIVIGDGLSPPAVAAQVPSLLPLLVKCAAARSWRVGQPFAVRYCRVGILNEIGMLIDPAVVVLLVGERPGLAIANSLSAYLAYRPRPGHTDAQRNLVSNIHERGVKASVAAERIARLVDQLLHRHISGVAVKEQTPTHAETHRLT